jgi:2'-5' RNA ligase
VAATAIVVPVAEAEPALGDWRRAHTTDGAEGMPPHVTLIHPFADEACVDETVTDGLRDVLADVAPFDVRFEVFARFDADPPVLYLEPVPAEPFLHLIGVIAARFPAYPPFGGLHETVVPHLTVGCSGDPGVLAAAEADVARQLPITARIAAAHVMTHDPAAGWRVGARISLGP